MPKVILFDVDNTLLSFDGYVKLAMKEGFREFEIGEYKEEMFGVFCKVNNALWKDIEEGRLDFAGLEKIRWNKVFEALGYTADGPSFEAYFRKKLFDNAIPEEGAPEILSYLHEKYFLCVATNGPYHQQVNRLKVGGMLPYFKELFISEEIGFSKPSADFFAVAFQRLRRHFPKLSPEEILMVGDSLSSDIMGGKAFGMKTCYYNPQEKAIPQEKAPDFTIFSLKELQEIL